MFTQKAGGWLSVPLRQPILEELISGKAWGLAVSSSTTRRMHSRESNTRSLSAHRRATRRRGRTRSRSEAPSRPQPSEIDGDVLSLENRKAARDTAPAKVSAKALQSSWRGRVAMSLVNYHSDAAGAGGDCVRDPRHSAARLCRLRANVGKAADVEAMFAAPCRCSSAASTSW